MSISPKTLGERLELALTIFKLSQAQASLETGVPQATISHLIRNQARTYKNSRALADGLNINHDWLVYGYGGIFNPYVHYVPVLDEYFRLRLYHSEGFLEVDTRFVVTERNYGNGVFATFVNKELIICTVSDGARITEDNMKFLLWTESRKVIINELLQGKRVFYIHETRQY